MRYLPLVPAAAVVVLGAFTFGMTHNEFDSEPVVVGNFYPNVTMEAGRVSYRTPAIELPPNIGSVLNRCDEYQVVYLDPESGTLYGDQDGNGLIDGDDCEWS